MSSLVPHLVNTPDNFKGGKIFYAQSLWRSLTQDSWIYDVVRGKFLEFVSLPNQTVPPRPLNLSRADNRALDNAIHHFLIQSIVEPCLPNVHGFFSNVFPIIKPVGPARVILNLK